MVDLLNFDDFRLASLADTNNNDCFENSFWVSLKIFVSKSFILVINFI